MLAMHFSIVSSFRLLGTIRLVFTGSVLHVKANVPPSLVKIKIIIGQFFLRKHLNHETLVKDKNSLDLYTWPADPGLV